MNHIFLILAGLWPIVSAADASADVCVRNATDTAHLFVAEVRGGTRVRADLAPGETLCASGTGRGVVSVFESAESLEGCSRLVSDGQTEDLLRYADFDRCAWSSHP